MERRLKDRFPPEFRGRKHQTRPSALFSPIFSRAREKIGPPEARQKRPRRNESLQARLLILCARFFLSKPQTEFAVWVFSMQICGNLSVSLRLTAPLEGEPRGVHRRMFSALRDNLSVCFADSIPTPFVPSGHFPLIGGIGPWEGSLCEGDSRTDTHKKGSHYESSRYPREFRQRLY